MQFLEFIKLSQEKGTLFSTLIQPLTDEEYTALYELFEEAGVKEEVEQVRCSRKRASYGLLSLLALIHEQKEVKGGAYQFIRHQQALEEVRRIVAWL